MDNATEVAPWHCCVNNTILCHFFSISNKVAYILLIVEFLLHFRRSKRK